MYAARTLYTTLSIMGEWVGCTSKKAMSLIEIALLPNRQITLLACSRAVNYCGERVVRRQSDR